MKLVNIKEKPLVPASHENPEDPGVLKKVLFSASDFNPECGLKMLNYAVIQPGRHFELHSHETLEEVFYILEGEGEITVGEETQVIGPEEAVLIPVKTQHIMKNIGDGPLVYLAFGAASDEGRTISPFS
ncbi:MAG TPA: cupin domain-containing protein [Vitreimonas sp.]|nr:cupin domain-containing protein [Vitreimonas sp.]